MPGTELHVQAALWTDNGWRFAVLILEGEAADKANGGAPRVDALHAAVRARGLPMTTDLDHIALRTIPGWRVRIGKAATISLEWPHHQPLCRAPRSRYRTVGATPPANTGSCWSLSDTASGYTNAHPAPRRTPPTPCTRQHWRDVLRAGRSWSRGGKTQRSPSMAPCPGRGAAAAPRAPPCDSPSPAASDPPERLGEPITASRLGRRTRRPAGCGRCGGSPLTSPESVKNTSVLGSGSRAPSMATGP